MKLFYKIMLFSLLPCYAGQVQAVDFSADVTSHLVAISSSFAGSAVVLFGSINGPGDIIAVVRGPPRGITMSRQGRIAGLWITSESREFLEVPSFYSVASSRPINEILAPGEAKKYQIGIANLTLKTKPAESSTADAGFREALERAQQREGMFSEVGKIGMFSERSLQSFRTTIEFPAKVPTGTYLVEIFLIQDKVVIGGQTTPLVVSKVGFVAALFEFASRNPTIYAAACAVWASLTGLALRAIFT